MISGHRPLWVLLILIFLLLLPAVTLAQNGSEATLSQPDTQNFPEISFFLSVYDSQGQFVRGLGTDDVQLSENNQFLPISDLIYVEPGVQFVVALNPGPSFAIRNSQGISRYDLIVQALRDWIDTYPATYQDDLSLLTTSGPRVTHLNSPQEWLQAFETYQPDARTLTPSFDILSDAIDIAADIPPVQGMAKAVLFITPPPEQNALPALENLTAIAQQQGVRIFTWMVASPAAFDMITAAQISETAFQTGGTAARFSGTEVLPSIHSYLDPLRGLYQGMYISQARISGEYQVVAQVNIDNELITTSPQTYTLEISPPNPVFIAPPTVIERSPQEKEDTTTLLVPTAQTIQILLEYPDGMPRDIVQSTLFVDGEPVDENMQEPFDTFRWELTSYKENSSHVLKAVVEDTLGLYGESIETPVRITISGQPSGIAAILIKQAPFIAVVAALAAGVVLVWVLIVGGRLRPADVTKPRNRRRDKDPVTQPVTIRSERKKTASPARQLASIATRLRLPQRSHSKQPLAFLEFLGTESNGGRGVPQPITKTDITFGRAVTKASNLLEDLSVSDLHARITRRPNGEFWIFDEGSVAGTWINYSPVGKDGQRLEHGDLIHIGRVGYRFKFPDETNARRIEIIRQDTT